MGNNELELTIATLAFLTAIVGLLTRIVGRKKVIEIRYGIIEPKKPSLFMRIRS